MGPLSSKKRKHESITNQKSQTPIKKFKKQTHYSSSSSTAGSEDEASDFPAVNLADSASDSDVKDDDPLENNKPHSTSTKQQTSASTSTTNSDSEASSSSASHTSSSKPRAPRTKNKRNDPTAFASSITSILTSKLSHPQRSDPVLARSSAATEANTALRESQLEKRVRQQLRAEKKALLEKGRVKDVLLGIAVGVGEKAEEEEGVVGRVLEEEKRLRKTAQRGVVKLFNAVRMAQVRGEEARKEAVGKGVVGAKRREEKVAEMSKKGFLELVAAGGGSGMRKGQMAQGNIEEG